VGTNDNEKDHNCPDGCDCDHDHGHGENKPTVTLTLEDDSEVECAILGTFDVDNNEYIALVPLNSDEALIYKFAEHGDGEIELSLIDDDYEFQKASEAFYEVFADDEDFEGEDFDDDEEIIYEPDEE